MVSSKKGPSRGSGLSKRASTSSSPLESSPSSATSGPAHERFDQDALGGVGIDPRRPPDRRAAGRAARTRRRAKSGSSARITPRLPESMSGFTTHGKPTPPGRGDARGDAPRHRSRGGRPGSAAGGCRDGPRRRAARASPACSAAALIASGPFADEPQPPRGRRRHPGRQLAPHRQHGQDRDVGRRGGVPGDDRGRLFGIREVDDQRVGRPVPRVIEDVTAIGRDRRPRPPRAGRRRRSRPRRSSSCASRGRCGGPSVVLYSAAR